MIRPFFTACVLMLVILSCKKDSNAPEYYFTFDVGTKHYSIDSVISLNPYSGQITFQLKNGDPENKNGLNFICYINPSASDTLIEGKYVDALPFNYSTTEKIIEYGYIIISIPNDANNGYFEIERNNEFYITVTEKTSNYMSGSFQGTLKNLTVSNGKFKVPYK